MRGSRRRVPRSRSASSRSPGSPTPRRPPGRGLGPRVVPMPPMRQHRLVRDPHPPAEIAGLHPSRLLPRHPDRAQEPEPAQQRQPVGTLRGLRQPPRLQVPQIRRDRADHPAGAVKQPDRARTDPRCPADEPSRGTPTRSNPVLCSLVFVTGRDHNPRTRIRPMTSGLAPVVQSTAELVGIREIGAEFRKNGPDRCPRNRSGIRRSRQWFSRSTDTSHRPEDTTSGAEQLCLLLRPSDEPIPSRCRESLQSFGHDVVLASPLGEVDPWMP